MLDVKGCRRQFPSLNRQVNGTPAVFLDGPGGTQVPQRVLDAIMRYLTACNANHGGVFTTSRESDAILHEAHQAAADLLNAPSAEEIVFGANMTTLTFHLSRAFGRTLKHGDEVLVTRLDHDANISPWVLAARMPGRRSLRGHSSRRLHSRSGRPAPPSHTARPAGRRYLCFQHRRHRQ